MPPRSGRRPGAAAAAEAVTALKPDAEPLALYCADAALAKALGWPIPLPLLAGELFARRATGEGRRPRPGEAGWMKLAALSYARAALAALDLAHDLSRRAARLADAAPKLRAKGKTGAIEALLADDAVAAGPRSPKLGAPYAYVTTEKFLLAFGFESLRDLPDIEALKDAGLLDEAQSAEQDVAPHRRKADISHPGSETSRDHVASQVDDHSGTPFASSP